MRLLVKQHQALGMPKFLSLLSLLSLLAVLFDGAETREGVSGIVPLSSRFSVTISSKFCFWSFASVLVDFTAEPRRDLGRDSSTASLLISTTTFSSSQVPSFSCFTSSAVDLGCASTRGDSSSLVHVGSNSEHVCINVKGNFRDNLPPITLTINFTLT